MNTQPNFVADAASPLFTQPVVVLDYGYDQSLTPAIHAVAEGLGIKPQQHMKLEQVPPNALLIANYADERVLETNIITDHIARGQKLGLNANTLYADINHPYLNPENALTRQHPVPAARLVLGGIAPATMADGHDAIQTERLLASLNLNPRPWRRHKAPNLLVCPPKPELVPFLETLSRLHYGPDSPHTFTMATWVENLKAAAWHAELNLVWRTRETSNRSLQHDLDDAAVVATVQSAVGPQALAQGIPALGVQGLCPLGNHGRPAVSWADPYRSGCIYGRDALLAHIVAHQAPLENLRQPGFVRNMLGLQLGAALQPKSPGAPSLEKTF